MVSIFKKAMSFISDALSFHKVGIRDSIDTSEIEYEENGQLSPKLQDTSQRDGEIQDLSHSSQSPDVSMSKSTKGHDLAQSLVDKNPARSMGIMQQRASHNTAPLRDIAMGKKKIVLAQNSLQLSKECRSLLSYLRQIEKVISKADVRSSNVKMQKISEKFNEVRDKVDAIEKELGESGQLENSIKILKDKIAHIYKKLPATHTRPRKS